MKKTLSFLAVLLVFACFPAAAWASPEAAGFTTVVMVGFYLLFPALVLYLCQRYPAADKIGAVILCYGAGMLIGNCGVLPAHAGRVLEGITTVAIPLALPLLLSAIFRIDVDTVIITSVAAICSPPFVPMVAGALKNREIIVSGLTAGIIGYAVGNYLGVFCAYLFKSLS